MPTARQSLQDLLREMIADVSAKGYVSEAQMEGWTDRIRAATEAALGRPAEAREETRDRLRLLFDRFLTRGVFRRVDGINRFDVSMLAPTLRAELDRRVFAAADLIVVDRDEAVRRTVNRVRGWISSVPPGGTDVLSKVDLRAKLSKGVADHKYHKRFVDTDQGHKLIANVAELVAVGSGAIGGVWHDHGEHDKSYDARKEHLVRSGEFFLIRGSWADEQGLISHRGPIRFYDEVDPVGMKPNCRCWLRYVTSPRRLPPEALTSKGRAFVAAGADALARMRNQNA